MPWNEIWALGLMTAWTLPNTSPNVNGRSRSTSLEAPCSITLWRPETMNDTAPSAIGPSTRTALTNGATEAAAANACLFPFRVWMSRTDETWPP